MTRLLLGTALLGAALVSSAARAGDEDDIRAAFTAFQAALKAGDPEKIWPLLDTTTQAAADKAAATLKANHAKANKADQAKLEKAFGLSASEIGALTGKGYLKSKRFIGKTHEIPGSTVDKVVVEGDKATVHYTEEDKDKVTLPVVRQGGKWKASIRVE